MGFLFVAEIQRKDFVVKEQEIKNDPLVDVIKAAALEDEEYDISKSIVVSVYKEIVSGFSAFFSLITLSVIGEKLPIYEDTYSKKTLDNLSKALTDRWGKFKISYPQSASFLSLINNVKNSFIKNTINLALIAANASLAIVNIKLPIFKNTITSRGVDKLEQGWEKLENTKYIGWFARKARRGFEMVKNLLQNPLINNIAAYIGGIMLLGSGPVGISIVTAIAAADIINGAVMNNNIKVLEDELHHLRSIKNSRQKIESIDDITKRKAIFALKMNLLSFDKKDYTKNKPESSIIEVAKKSIIPIVSNQATAVMQIAGSAVNPIFAAVNISQSLASAAYIVSDKITNQEAIKLMQEEIQSLRKELKIEYDITKSRKYDLAKIACDYKIYADTLSGYNNNISDINNYKENIEIKIKSEELFHPDKIDKPKDFFSFSFRAMKSSFISMGNYLHPFKPQLSYVDAWKKYNDSIVTNSTSMQKNDKIRSSASLKPNNTPLQGMKLSNKSRNISLN